MVYYSPIIEIFRCESDWLKPHHMTHYYSVIWPQYQNFWFWLDDIRSHDSLFGLIFKSGNLIGWTLVTWLIILQLRYLSVKSWIMIGWQLITWPWYEWVNDLKEHTSLDKDQLYHECCVKLLLWKTRLMGW